WSSTWSAAAASRGGGSAWCSPGWRTSSPSAPPFCCWPGICVSCGGWPYRKSTRPRVQAWFPDPRRPADFVLMVVKYAAGAFAEEVVTRAYLVTRLEGLLKSRAAAVLLAAAAFASYHAYQRTDGLVDTFLLGVAWGAAFLFLRRLWPFVFAHAL